MLSQANPKNDPTTLSLFFIDTFFVVAINFNWAQIIMSSRIMMAKSQKNWLKSIYHCYITLRIASLRLRLIWHECGIDPVQ